MRASELGIKSDTTQLGLTLRPRYLPQQLTARAVIILSRCDFRSSEFKYRVSAALLVGGAM
jgi:hypothetical protein